MMDEDMKIVVGEEDSTHRAFLVDNTNPAWWKDNVNRGVEWLDGKVENWREKVDMDSLIMESCSRCVLGQVFGSYYQGLDEIGEDEYEENVAWTFSHGFSIHDWNCRTDRDELRWAALEAAWRDELAKYLV